MQELSLVVASGGHSSSRCAGLSLSRPLLLRSTGSRRAGSVIVAHRTSCSAACGILPDQGSNPRPLHRQADSQPLRHPGSLPPPPLFFLPIRCWSGSCIAFRCHVSIVNFYLEQFLSLLLFFKPLIFLKILSSYFLVFFNLGFSDVSS